MAAKNACTFANIGSQNTIGCVSYSQRLIALSRFCKSVNYALSVLAEAIILVVSSQWSGIVLLRM